MTTEPIIWTPKTLLEWTEEYFRGKGVPTPRLDGEILLSHVLHCQRIDLYLQFDRPLTDPELAAFRVLVKARGERRPVAYLVGQVGFWNLTLSVNESCLIPSPDTETLVEGVLAAIADLRADGAERPLKVLELGTGTGAIPLAVCAEVSGLTWVAAERSAAALAVARENRQRYEALLIPKGNGLWLVHGDRFQALRADWRPHLVVGNPPYIPTATIDRLMPEVSRAEPRLALDGGRDGMDFQRYMIAYAARALQPGGRLLLEMGAEQSGALHKMVEETPGLRLVEFRKDLSGHPRVLNVEQSGF